MLNLLLGILILFFTKEFIVVNQELIIYIIFISLFFIMINVFSFLSKTFDNVRYSEQNLLEESSLRLLSNICDIILRLEARHNFYLINTTNDINFTATYDV